MRSRSPDNFWNKDTQTRADIFFEFTMVFPGPSTPPLSFLNPGVTDMRCWRFFRHVIVSDKDLSQTINGRTPVPVPVEA
jgi:hypothetical protein